MKPGSIRCIAFDVVGTLLFADPPVHMAYHRIGERFGSQLDPVTIRQSFRDAMARRGPATAGTNDILGDTAVVGHLTSEEDELRFWRNIVGDVLPDVEDRESCFQALFDHFAQPASWGCFMDVEETLPILAERGFTLAMASNFDSRLHAVCEGHHALRDISKRVVSSEIGFRKPSPRFFEFLAETCGCEPFEILMVGDDADCDVQAAIRSGLQAIHLDRSGTLGSPAISNLDELLQLLTS